MPKATMRLIPSKFQTRGQSTAGLPVRVVTVSIEAELGTVAYDDDVKKVCLKAKADEHQILAEEFRKSNV
jgi:hypothetical protein